MRLRSMLVLGLAIGVAMMASVALALITPVPVIAEPAAQYEPHGNGTYIAWSSNSTARPTQWNAIARLVDGVDRIRMNASGTDGQTGGFESASNRVIYQQWTKRDSGIYFFDLDTQQRTKAVGVNSSNWEGLPRVSATYIFLHRYVRRGGDWYEELYLYPRSGGSLQRIGSWRDSRWFVYTGSVGDRYAAWTVCARTSRDDACNAVLYDIETSSTKRIAEGVGVHRYAPIVDELNGHVYFTTAGRGCGNHAAVRQLPLDQLTSTPTLIAELPTGIDTGWTLALAENADTGMLDILFERWNCARKVGDIYAIRDVAPGAP